MRNNTLIINQLNKSQQTQVFVVTDTSVQADKHKCLSR